MKNPNLLAKTNYSKFHAHFSSSSSPVLKNYIKPTMHLQNQIIFTLTNPMWATPSRRNNLELASLLNKKHESQLMDWSFFNKDSVLRSVASIFFTTDVKYTNLYPSISRFEKLCQLEKELKFEGTKGTKNILLVTVSDKVTLVHKRERETGDSDIYFPINFYKANTDNNSNFYVMEVAYNQFFERPCIDLFIANRHYLPRLTLFHFLNKHWGDIVYNFRAQGVLIGGGAEKKRHMLSKPHLALSQYLNLFTGPFSGEELEESFKTSDILSQYGKLVKLDNSKKRNIANPFTFFYPYQSNIFFLSTRDYGNAPYYIDVSEFNSEEKDRWLKVTGTLDKRFFINSAFRKSSNIPEGYVKILWGNTPWDIFSHNNDAELKELSFIFNEESISYLLKNPESTSEIFKFNKETQLNVTDVFLRDKKWIYPYSDSLYSEKYRPLKKLNSVNTLIIKGRRNSTLTGKINKREYSYSTREVPQFS